MPAIDGLINQSVTRQQSSRLASKAPAASCPHKRGNQTRGRARTERQALQATGSKPYGVRSSANQQCHGKVDVRASRKKHRAGRAQHCCSKVNHLPCSGRL